MGATKDMWVDAIKAIVEAYRVSNVDLDEAVGALTRMGLNKLEAETMLSEAIP